MTVAEEGGIHEIRHFPIAGLGTTHELAVMSLVIRRALAAGVFLVTPDHETTLPPVRAEGVIGVAAAALLTVRRGAKLAVNARESNVRYARHGRSCGTQVGLGAIANVLRFLVGVWDAGGIILAQGAIVAFVYGPTSI